MRSSVCQPSSSGIETSRRTRSGRRRVELAQALPAVSASRDVVARALEQLADEPADVAIVVDDEDAGPLHTRSIPDAADIRPPSDDGGGGTSADLRAASRGARASRPHRRTRIGHEPVLDDAALCGRRAIVLEPAHAPSRRARGGLRAAHDGDSHHLRQHRPPDMRGSRRLAPVAHLVKPFALPELEAALDAALDGGRQSPLGPLTTTSRS